jgi:hypothetical protein
MMPGEASSCAAAVTFPRQSRRKAESSPSKAPLLRKGHWGGANSNNFTDWNDCQPETELNFKFYRQVTNEIVGISDEALAFLDDRPS